MRPSSQERAMRQPASLEEALVEIERLRATAEDLEDFVENGAVGLHWEDARGVLIWVNQAELDLLGYSREEYIGRNITEFHTDPVAIQDILERLSRNETLHNYPSTMRAKDGSIRHVLMTSNVRWDGDRFLHTRCFTRDITALRQAETSLRESERRRQLAMEAARIGTWEYDVHTGKVVWTGIAPIHGVSEDSFGGSFESYLADVHPEDREYVLKAISTAFEAGRPLEMEYRIVRPGGEIRWVRGEGQVVRDAAGQSTGMIGVCMDINAQRLALEAEQRARQSAEDSSRLKDEFLATVSHELRTPLNAILGWSDMLLRDQVKPDRVPHALLTISANAKRQQKLVEDLLDVSRVISGKLRLELADVEVNSMLESAIEVTAPAAEAKGVPVDLRVAPGLGSMLGDSNRLQQVFWNLLSNAIKFTPAGGRVEVDAVKANDELAITVRDTGVGIAPEFLPFVFAPFRQADAAYTRSNAGLGLGLAIAKHLIELHGGTITASSPGAGQGATFVVAFPLRRAVVTPGIDRSTDRVVDADPIPAPVPDLAGIRVLVVDDEPDARELVAEFLTTCGAEVMAAASGAEADRWLARQTPHVMLVDIAMPHEDGCTFHERFRRERAGADVVPAVALTAHATPADLERSRRAGFALHLRKPVELAEIANVVASLAHPVARPTGSRLD